MTLFWGVNPRPVTLHQHPTIQIILAPNGTFKTKNERGNWIDKSCLLIAPNYKHECNAENIEILAIDIDPESTLGDWMIKNYLYDTKITDFPFSSSGLLLKKINLENWEGVRNALEMSFRFEASHGTSPKDHRIEKVLDFIDENIDGVITTQTLMDVSHLSESRLLHLFKEQIGIPIRNYILWVRLKIVFAKILKGHSLTTAAMDAGFSDQAHMTRTFTKTIGLPPSIFTKNSKFIQVFLQ